MLILIAQKKRLGSLNATQKTIGLCQVLFLRKSRKTSKKFKLPIKCQFLDILVVFLDFLSNGTGQRPMIFLRCVQCTKTLLLRYQNQHSEKISDFSP